MQFRWARCWRAWNSWSGACASEFPRSGLFVSTSTLAGRATAGEKLAGLADGVFYAPVDYVFAVRRVLRTLQPSVVAIAETEIWPNLFREVKRTGAGLTIVNGRISDRAFPRYRRFRWLFRAVLPAADSILAQTDEMRERFAALGAPARADAHGAAISSTISRPGRRRRSRRWRRTWSARGRARSGSPPAPCRPRTRRCGRRRRGDRGLPRIGRAASRPAADSGAAQAGAVRRGGAETGGGGDSVCAAVEAGGAGDAAAPCLLPHVLLLDTIGELSGLFGFADVVFMGGTLARRGGHNILEPASLRQGGDRGAAHGEFSGHRGAVPRSGGVPRNPGRRGTGGRGGSASAGAGPGGRHRTNRAEVCRGAARGYGARGRRGAQTACEPLARLPAGMPWFALRWALSLLWIVGARSRQAADLQRPAQDRRSGDQRGKPDHGRHRQDAVRAAPGRRS